MTLILSLLHGANAMWNSVWSLPLTIGHIAIVLPCSSTVRPIKKFTFRSYGTVIINLRI